MAKATLPACYGLLASLEIAHVSRKPSIVGLQLDPSRPVPRRGNDDGRAAAHETVIEELPDDAREHLPVS
jgi:hypothetical protein